jgi:photosystem II stability/assembly factor-like uncharacterized protein
MHRSFDGEPWQLRSNGLPGPNEATFNDLTADPTSAGTVFVASTPSGVYRTRNDGQSWQPVNNGLPSGDLNVKGIAISPVSGRILISINGHGLWRSDDQGDSWVRSDSGITYNTTLQGSAGIPAFSPYDGDVVYAYNNDGSFVSHNGGKTWAPFNDCFNGNETLTTMAFHPAAPGTVLAGTAVSGIWSLTVVPGGRFYVPLAVR